MSGSDAARTHAEFSSVGPTTISLRLKPDVAAPGVDVLSSVPAGWSSFSGTSMASPHVAGAAALLLQRHPELDGRAGQVGSGSDGNRRRRRAATPRRPAVPGRWRRRLAARGPAALFAEPTGVSFGLLGRGARVTGSSCSTTRVEAPAPGRSSASLASPRRCRLVVPATVTVPGELDRRRPRAAARAGRLRRATSSFDAARTYAGSRSGVACRPAPRASPAGHARQAGMYRGTTRRQSGSRLALPLPGDTERRRPHTTFRGPEACSASASRSRVANFGVVVTQRGRQPRRAARRRGSRREPTHGLRGPPRAPQPVPRRLP